MEEQVRGQTDEPMNSCNLRRMVNESDKKHYTCQQVCEYKWPGHRSFDAGWHHKEQVREKKKEKTY